MKTPSPLRSQNVLYFNSKYEQHNSFTFQGIVFIPFVAICLFSILFWNVSKYYNVYKIKNH